MRMTPIPNRVGHRCPNDRLRVAGVDECASTPKVPHLMDRQSPAATGGRSAGRPGRGAPPGWG
jgi:hypothetical protein